MSSRKLRRNMMGRSEKGTPSVTEGLQKDPFRHRGATLSLYFSFWIRGNVQLQHAALEAAGEVPCD